MAHAIEGSLAPASPVTDADGISRARWTLQPLFAQQIAGASIDWGPAAVTFTAIATPDPHAWNTVLVGPGGNRFEPAELTIAVGETVNWLWLEGSSAQRAAGRRRHAAAVRAAGGLPALSQLHVREARGLSLPLRDPRGSRWCRHVGTITVLQTCGSSCTR